MRRVARASAPVKVGATPMLMAAALRPGLEDRAAGVDAAAGQRDVRGDLQVGGRDPHGAAALVAGDHDALDRVRSREQRDHLGDLAGRDQAADPGGRDGLAVRAGDRGGRLDVQAARAAELGQHRDGARAAVAEAEVLADDDRLRAHRGRGEHLGEALGPDPREGLREGHHQQLLHPEALDQLALEADRRRGRRGAARGGARRSAGARTSAPSPRGAARRRSRSPAG